MHLTKTVPPKQLEANRNNALHSTGPKTPAGKKNPARSARLISVGKFILGGVE